MCTVNMPQEVTDLAPITGICIVSNAAKCPPGYDMLIKSHDKREDCDLWKDSILRRITRYLCFTRDKQSAQKLPMVLASLVILNDKDIPPDGYTLLDRTNDTAEKACKKKQICVKWMDRNKASDAITDIIILSRIRRAPDGYTSAGDINGLLVCYKVGQIPPETQNFKHSVAPPPIPAKRAINYQCNGIGGIESRARNSPVPGLNSSVHRTGSGFPSNPIADVPFQLHAAYQSTDSRTIDAFKVDDLYRSLADIENEFCYLFTLERSIISQSRF